MILIKVLNYGGLQENEKLDPARVSNSLPNNAGTRDIAQDLRAKGASVGGGGGRRGEPEPAGFNQLDYLPPKTHPPVHNWSPSN